MDASNWQQRIFDVSDAANEEIDAVDVQSDSLFPTILDGWTFELKKIGFENAIGSNWQQSCYNTGTPGDPPIDCPHSDCSTTTCAQNGDTSASINPSTGFCTCSSGFYPTGCTCMSIPQPSQCMAQRVKLQNASTSWYTLYYWDRAEYDEEIQYELQYET